MLMAFKPDFDEETDAVSFAEVVDPVTGSATEAEDAAAMSALNSSPQDQTASRCVPTNSIDRILYWWNLATEH